MALRDGWFVRVKAAVDAVDPVGLLGLGAPKDEYEPEVAELAGMARSGQPLTAEAIVAVFDRWFEPGACSLARAERIAALLVTRPMAPTSVTSLRDGSQQDFGVPEAARAPDPPKGADYAAVGALSRGGSLEAYVLMTVRTWTRRGRGVQPWTGQMPDVVMVWVGERGSLPGYDDGILVEEGGDDYALLRAGQVRLSGVVYDVEWIAWPEAAPIVGRYFT